MAGRIPNLEARHQSEDMADGVDESMVTNWRVGKVHRIRFSPQYIKVKNVAEGPLWDYSKKQDFNSHAPKFLF